MKTLSRLLLALLIACTLAPAVAVAQDSPFQPLPQAPQTNTDVVVPPGTQTTSSDDGDQGLSTGAEVAIFVAGGLLIGGIAFVIVRDARQHAPSDKREGRFAGRGEALPADAPNPTAAKRRTDAKRKAAAKRARNARKQNRPR